MTTQRVLMIGLIPEVADLDELPEITPTKIRLDIDEQVKAIEHMGLEVDNCLIDRGETAEEVVGELLSRESYALILIGAGVRAPNSTVILFEKLLNLIIQESSASQVCFNTSPSDSVEAIQRWL